MNRMVYRELIELQILDAAIDFDVELLVFTFGGTASGENSRTLSICIHQTHRHRIIFYRPDSWRRGGGC